MSKSLVNKSLVIIGSLAASFGVVAILTAGMAVNAKEDCPELLDDRINDAIREINQALPTPKRINDMTFYGRTNGGKLCTLNLSQLDLDNF